MKISNVVRFSGRRRVYAVERMVRAIKIFKPVAWESGHFWASVIDDSDLMLALRFNCVKDSLQFIDLVARDELIKSSTGGMFGGILLGDRFEIDENYPNSKFWYSIGRSHQLVVGVEFIWNDLDPFLISASYCNFNENRRARIEFVDLGPDGRINLELYYSQPRDLVRVFNAMSLMTSLSFYDIENLFYHNEEDPNSVQYDIVIESVGSADILSMMSSQEYDDYKSVRNNMGHLLAGVEGVESVIGRI